MPKTGVYGEPCIEKHTALIFDRGGARRILQVLDISSISYPRVIDGQGKAHLEVSGRACRAQTATLRQIAPRRHELVIYRGSDRVWEGPIVQTLSTSSQFTIDAIDVSEYLFGRSLSKAWPNAANGGDTSIKTVRLQEIIEYELATGYTMTTTDGDVAVPAWEDLEPPANVLPFLDVRHAEDPDDAGQTTADTQPFQMTVGSHLSDLVENGGVHYTTIGRRIVIWDSTLNLGRLRVVSETDFSGDFNVIDAGSDFATIEHVVGTQGDDASLPPAVGHAAVPAEGIDYYGPWERVDPTSSENADQSAPDQGALNSQAKATVKSLYPLPKLLETASGASLIPTAGLTMAQLVPGVIVPVVAKGNIRDVRQDQRLDSITVTEDNQQGEKIATTLGAAGMVEAA